MEAAAVAAAAAAADANAAAAAATTAAAAAHRPAATRLAAKWIQSEIPRRKFKRKTCNFMQHTLYIIYLC